MKLHQLIPDSTISMKDWLELYDSIRLTHSVKEIINEDGILNCSIKRLRHVNGHKAYNSKTLNFKVKSTTQAKNSPYFAEENKFPTEKYCTKCPPEIGKQPIVNFRLMKVKRKNGKKIIVSSECKKCHQKLVVSNAKRQPEKVKQYQQKYHKVYDKKRWHSDTEYRKKSKEYLKNRYKTNASFRASLLQRSKDYQEKRYSTDKGFRERHLDASKKYYEDNKPKVLKQRKAYYKKKKNEKANHTS